MCISMFIVYEIYMTMYLIVVIHSRLMNQSVPKVLHAFTNDSYDMVPNEVGPINEF